MITGLAQTTVLAEDAPILEKQNHQTLHSRKEAYRASTNQIVLHYGEGIRGVRQIKEILVKRGYPAIAYPGGSKGIVELFIHRGIVGKYDQDAVDDGELGGDAITFYKERVKPET